MGRRNKQNANRKKNGLRNPATTESVDDNSVASRQKKSDTERIDSVFYDLETTGKAANNDSLIDYIPEDLRERAGFNKSQVKEKARPRSWRYELVALVALLVIWIPAGLLLRYAPPVYTSSWTIVIPGTTSAGSIDLDSLGEANTSVGSQYGGKSIDPKVNYKAIVLSSTVLERAADMTDMSIDDFGSPKVNLVDQTAMMEVVLKSDDATTARDKAQNLYNAFSMELDTLRMGERIIRQNDSRQQLAEYKLDVEKAQDALRKFRANSEIVSTDQYKDLLVTVGEVTEQRRNSITRLEALKARIKGLEFALGIDPGIAGHVVKLRQDLMVQSQLRAYTEAHAAMVQEESILGRKHPKVVHARSRTNRAYGVLLNRADEVLGMDSRLILNSFMPNESADDFTIYSQLVQLHGDQLALESEVELLRDKLPELKEQVVRFAEAASHLEDLERAHEIASTILVSATARLDLGKSDIYASYPMTQLLVSAELPDKPGRLQKLFVLLGAIVGTFLVLLALIVLWNRKLWLRLIQKSE